MHFRFFDIPFEITCDSARIAAQVEVLFDLFRDAGGDEPLLTYEIVSGHEGFDILREGRILEPLPGVTDPLVTLEEYVMRDVIAERPGILFIHAAVLAKHGMGLVLPGQSGAGKSTLAYALASRGWIYYSDEVAPIELRGMEVLPFPRSIKLRPGAERIFPHLASHFRDGDGYRHYCGVRKLGVRIGESAAPVRLLVFPSRCAGLAPRLAAMSRSVAVTMLAQCCFSFSRDQGKALQQIAALVNGVQCYSLQTGDLGESCAIIERLAEEAAAQPAYG